MVPSKASSPDHEELPLLWTNHDREENASSGADSALSSVAASPTSSTAHLPYYNSNDDKETFAVNSQQCEHMKEGDDHEPASVVHSDRQRQVSRRMRTLTFFAAVGGFLSGYNCGVLAGALLPLKRVFQLTSVQEEAIVSATILSAFLASLAGGTINTYLGRRRTLLLAGAIFTLGGCVLLTALNFASLVLGEVLLGIAIGLESLTSPLYIAEVAKPSVRGILVSMYALMMCLGQFFAGIMDGVFGAVLPESWGWRCMFGCACLPGIVMFSGFLFLPESPSWLMAHSCCEREDEARTILLSVRDTDQEVALELKALRQTIHIEEIRHTSVWRSTLQMLRDESTRNALIVGCGLMVLQQICGVNGVMYYAASVYQMAGFAELTSIWLSAFTAFAQIIGLAMSVVLIEKKGRRGLVICSFVCIGLCSVGLGWSFYGAKEDSDFVLWDRIDPECAQQAALVWDGVTRNCFDCVSIPGCGYCGNSCVKGNADGPLFGLADNGLTCPANTIEDWTYDVCTNSYGWMSVLFMVVYLIVFGIGAAGLPWTINSEIYPVRYRSLAVSISTGTNWLSNLLVSSTFLTINSPAVLTSYGSFWMYALICFLGAAWLYVYLPETKGLSMEEIEQAFRSKDKGLPTTVYEQERMLICQQQLPINIQDGTFGTSHSGYEKPPCSSGDTVITCEEESASSSAYGSVCEYVSSDDED